MTKDKQEKSSDQTIDEQPKKIKTKKEEESKTPGFPAIKPGLVVKVYQKIKEKNPKGEEKERIQAFEGMVIARQHGQGINSTITVRKVSDGVGVEKIFPLHLPTITKIEVIKAIKTRRSKLYYLRNYQKRLKAKGKN
jgi:large subunit ribosomal protein L19